MSRERDVLQHLAVAGLAETADVAEAVSAPESEVEETLGGLEEAGYVEEGGFWYVTSEGEERLAELCRARFSDDELDQLRRVFEEFEALDSRMKALASEWQERDSADAGGIIDDLADLHGDVEALFEEVGPGVRPEYEPYLESLSTALAALRGGREAYFTGTEVDSYHDVWFELHDDLLRTLGEKRAD